jgi:hypothetical protein
MGGRPSRATTRSISKGSLGNCYMSPILRETSTATPAVFLFVRRTAGCLNLGHMRRSRTRRLKESSPAPTRTPSGAWWARRPSCGSWTRRSASCILPTGPCGMACGNHCGPSKFCVVLHFRGWGRTCYRRWDACSSHARAVGVLDAGRLGHARVVVGLAVGAADGGVLLRARDGAVPHLRALAFGLAPGPAAPVK